MTAVPTTLTLTVAETTAPDWFNSMTEGLWYPIAAGNTPGLQSWQQGLPLDQVPELNQPYLETHCDRPFYDRWAGSQGYVDAITGAPTNLVTWPLSGVWLYSRYNWRAEQIEPWVGGAYDTDRNRLVLPLAGGHTSLTQNGAYALELTKDPAAPYWRCIVETTRGDWWAKAWGDDRYIPEHGDPMGRDRTVPGGMWFRGGSNWTNWQDHPTHPSEGTSNAYPAMMYDGAPVGAHTAGDMWYGNGRIWIMNLTSQGTASSVGTAGMYSLDLDLVETLPGQKALFNYSGRYTDPFGTSAQEIMARAVRGDGAFGANVGCRLPWRFHGVKGFPEPISEQFGWTVFDEVANRVIYTPSKPSENWSTLDVAGVGIGDPEVDLRAFAYVPRGQGWSPGFLCKATINGHRYMLFSHGETASHVVRWCKMAEYDQPALYGAGAPLDYQGTFRTLSAYDGLPNWRYKNADIAEPKHAGFQHHIVPVWYNGALYVCCPDELEDGTLIRKMVPQLDPVTGELVNGGTWVCTEIDLTAQGKIHSSGLYPEGTGMRNGVYGRFQQVKNFGGTPYALWLVANSEHVAFVMKVPLGGF